MATTRSKTPRPKGTITKLRRAGHPVLGLTGPLLHFDLAAETEQLRQEEAWRTAARSAKTLVKYPDLRIVLIAMKAGTRMEGHKADGSISVQPLSGRLRLHLPEKTVELLAGNLLTIERALPHDVEAVEESVFLLSISWPKGAAK